MYSVHIAIVGGVGWYRYIEAEQRGNGTYDPVHSYVGEAFPYYLCERQRWETVRIW